MRRLLCAAATAVLVFALGAEGAAAQRGQDRLDAYTAVVTAEQLAAITERGYDVTGQQAVTGGVQVDLILTRAQSNALRRSGVGVRLTRVKGGKTVKQFAAEQAESGYQVWRSWDEPGGIRDQMQALARNNPQLVKLVELGTTYEGRKILAVKITQGARGQADGSRPAVLYSATQHAREWIATEVDRRLMHWYVDRWRANDPEVKRLLKGTELWFVPVANPDGYEYTFDVERLWR